MTRIFLIRHGEAEGNLFRRCQGQFNAPLTRRGRQQAEYLTPRFADIPVDAAFSSDLRRAFETTCAAMRRCGVDVIPDKRLREISCGAWEDRAWGDIRYTCPREMDAFFHDPERCTVTESFTALGRRMKEAVLDYAARYPDGTVVLGSHGMAIRTLLADLQGVGSADIDSLPIQENTAVSLLTADHGVIRIEYQNDYSHLPSGLLPAGAGDIALRARVRGDRNLRYEPLDVQAEESRSFFLRCYADAWQTAHGNLDGFDPGALWTAAACRALRSPGSLQAAYLGEERVGLLALDEQHGKRQGIGWVAFCYVLPAMRGRRFGTQLMGAAISRYRHMGRRTLQLCVAPENPALSFYGWLGMRECGVMDGATEPLLIMERDISL